MKTPSLTLRLVMVLCAVMLLLAQLMGLHFHRHAHAMGAHAEHRTTVHLRDADVHAHAALEHGDHHSLGDRAAHPDADLEIDPLGAGLTKIFKFWIAPALLLFMMLLLLGAGSPLPIRMQWLIARAHPALFVLRPPSNAPPLKLSTAR